jgi:hypothetical protein
VVTGAMCAFTHRHCAGAVNLLNYIFDLTAMKKFVYNLLFWLVAGVFMFGTTSIVMSLTGNILIAMPITIGLMLLFFVVLHWYKDLA